MTPSWFTVHRCGDIAQVAIGDNLGCSGAGAGELLAELEGVSEVRLTVNSIGGDGRAAIEVFDGLRGRVRFGIRALNVKYRRDPRIH
ncbi:MAG: hypothetical protein FJ398_07930 [Verrucomicrobia bacterium]|nr:hypothetical protein [Verrucomicrobiota bacterium]